RCDPSRRGPEYLMHLGRLVRDRRDRGEADDGVAIAMHLFDPQSRELVGNLGFDVTPEQLVDQVLRRQSMAHHAPAELDRLELLFLWAQLRGLVLEPPRGMDEAGMG